MEKDVQQENHNQSIGNPVLSPKNNKKWFLVVSVIIGVIVLVGGGYFCYQYLAKLEASNKYAIDGFSPKFFYPQANFELNLPDGWHLYDVSDGDLPLDLMKKEDVSFSFIKSNTPCVLTYGLSPQSIFGKYHQTSFAQRVFTTNEDQIDSSWYVHDLFRPQGLEFLWKGEQPIAHEVRIMIYPHSQGGADDNYYYIFALYNKDELEVDGQCDKDVSNILSSIKRKFNSITDIDDGILYITSIYNFPNAIVFIPNGKTEGFSFAEFESNSWIQPFLLNNYLYFVNDGKIYILDLLSGESSLLSGIDYSGGKVVSDFSIIDNDLFFLLGEPCDFVCNDEKDLYQYNIAGKTVVKLISGIKSNIILGLDKNKNYLYLAQAWGDAGCFSTKIESYDINTKELKDGEKYRGCEGEPGVEELYTKYEDFINGLEPVILSTDYLIIKDKQVYLSNSKLSTINNRRTFRYVSDQARILLVE